MNIKPWLRRSLAAGVLALASASAHAGTPEWLDISDAFGSHYQPVVSGQPSGRLHVKLFDTFGLPATTTTVVSVELRVRDSSYSQVPFDLTLDDGATYFTNITSFTITVGAGNPMSGQFRIRLSTQTFHYVEIFTANFLGMGARGSQCTLDVLASGAGFTGVNLVTASQPPGTTGQTSVTITPNNDGEDDAAIIEATPPGGGSWEVFFSPVDFSTAAPAAYANSQAHFFLFGPSQFYWYGTDQQGRRVPNGTYYVRMQTNGGGIVDDSLQVEVLSAFIQGRIVNNSSATIAGANIQVWGPGGGGSAFTGIDGKFFVGGLTPGQSYTVNVHRTGYADEQIQDVPANTDLLDIFLDAGATLLVQVAATQATDHDLYGSVYGRTADFSSNVWAPLRLASGTLTTDDGIFPVPSAFTALSLLPNTQYEIFAELPELGRVQLTTTTVGEGTTYYWTPTLVRKANISGTITVPTAVDTPYGGEWISVDATLQGDNFPSHWGGAVIQDGQTTGNYTINGVDVGTYNLRTYSRGYVSSSTSVVVASTVDVNGINFTLSEGGALNVTVNVIGDSSNVQVNQYYGPSGCGGGQIPLFVNAHSPETYTGGFVQVCYTTGAANGSASNVMKGMADGTYEIHAYLPGFQIEPPGRNLATVSGGAGSASVTFRRLSGTLTLSATVPGDPTQVSYEMRSLGFYDGGLQEPSGNLDPSGQAVITGLGTGLYEVTFVDNTTGLQKRVPVAVTNGQSASVSVNMTEATYQISGTVDVQGNIALTSPYNVTVSSTEGLQLVVATAPTVIVQGLSDGGVTVSSPTAASGAFTFSGFPNGVYRVSVMQDFNFTNNCFSGPGCFPVNMPEIASSEQIVYIENASATGADVTIQNGSQVSGTISRPLDDDDTTARTLEVSLFPMGNNNNNGGDNFQWWASSVSLTGTSASFAFTHIAEGSYFLSVRDRGNPAKYVAPDALIEVGSGDVSQDVTLQLAGTIVGRIRDADSGTLITQQNAATLLPQGFEIHAEANPWTPGGFANANQSQSGPGPALNSSNQFVIDGVLPDTSYDVTLSGNRLTPEMIARGQKAYAPAVVSGILVSGGQTVDLGTIDISQGVGITGTVTDTAGATLPNVRVIGKPALLEGEDVRNYFVETFTDKDGNYSLQGVDPNQRYYDVIASPRFDGGDIFGQLAGKKYGEETVQMVDVTDPATRTGVDFQLTEANGALSGRVATEDGGELSVPFGDSQRSFERQAMVFLHQEGTPYDDNPIGEIEEPTDPDGNFSIQGLKPGTYIVTAVSVGYATAKKTVIVAAGANDAGTITLERGATVTGTITKPDGSAPSTEDVKFLVAADDDFDEFVFAAPDSTSDGEVTGYTMTGFRPGVDYNIIIITGNDDLLQAASGVRFTSKTEEKTVNLVYRPAPPSVYATQTRVGNRFTLRFFSTHKLRNLTDADNDLDQIVTLTQGNGTVVSKDLSGSRDLITVVYDAAANEKTFKFSLDFVSIQQDLDDPEGDNFEFQQEFKFFAGARRMRVIYIPNALGGNVRMEGENTSSGFVSGTFDGDGIGGSSSIQVGIVSAEDYEDVAQAPTPGRRALGVARAAAKLGPEAYPSAGMYRAVQAAPSVSPFSSFYDVFLPAGVSHSFKKEALLTLAYDATVTDPSSLNVYYFDPNNNVFLLEGTKRKIDTKNKTITVAVNHASTFVVLNNNAPIVGANTYAGTEITVHNFPNPFNLKSKTVSLSNAPASPTQTITGTLIRYALPAGKTGAVKIDIYNVAGELVRTINETAAAGGTYYYTEWDGKNDGGKNVASGAYIARFTLNDGDERFFKMAVVK